MPTLKINLPIKDFPINECREGASRILDEGGTIWQKWTCERCGSREMQKTPNIFFPFCECQCGHVTSVERCNYRIQMPVESFLDAVEGQ